MSCSTQRKADGENVINLFPDVAIGPKNPASGTSRALTYRTRFESCVKHKVHKTDVS